MHSFELPSDPFIHTFIYLFLIIMSIVKKLIFPFNLGYVEVTATHTADYKHF